MTSYETFRRVMAEPLLNGIGIVGNDGGVAGASGEQRDVGRGGVGRGAVTARGEVPE